MEVTEFQQENGYKKTSTPANGVPQRGETAFRSAVPCAWSPRVPQALASNCQRFRSREGSSTVRKPWPEENKRPSQGDRRYKLVETAVTVGALFGAAPHPCATNLQRNDAVQERGRACGCRPMHPMHSLLVNGASCVCTSQGTLCSLGYRWYGANRRAMRAAQFPPEILLLHLQTRTHCRSVAAGTDACAAMPARKDDAASCCAP